MFLLKKVKNILTSNNSYVGFLINWKKWDIIDYYYRKYQLTRMFFIIQANLNFELLKLM